MFEHDESSHTVTFHLWSCRTKICRIGCALGRPVDPGRGANRGADLFYALRRRRGECCAEYHRQLWRCRWQHHPQYHFHRRRYHQHGYFLGSLGRWIRGKHPCPHPDDHPGLGRQQPGQRHSARVWRRSRQRRRHHQFDQRYPHSARSGQFLLRRPRQDVGDPLGRGQSLSLRPKSG